MATNLFRPVVAPNLPVAAPQYSAQYEDQYSNVLRLYFNQLDNFTRSLANSGGGALISFPYFSAYQNGVTTLTSGMTNVSTTPISVASTADFSSSGYLLIGSEIIQYTSTTATTFAGTITRGVKGTTNVAHTSGDYVTEVDAVTVGTSKAMKLDTLIGYNQITCTVPDSKVYFTNSGNYNLQFSAQLLNFTTSDDNVTIWLKQNGTDVTASAGIVQVPPKHGSAPGATIASWNYVTPVTAGDYLELYWSSDSGNTVLATYPPGSSPVHPASPSLIMSVAFVSA